MPQSSTNSESRSHAASRHSPHNLPRPSRSPTLRLRFRRAPGQAYGARRSKRTCDFSGVAATLNLWARGWGDGDVPAARNSRGRLTPLLVAAFARSYHSALPPGVSTLQTSQPPLDSARRAPCAGFLDANRLVWRDGVGSGVDGLGVLGHEVSRAGHPQGSLSRDEVMAKTVVRVLSAEAGSLAQMAVAWTGARSPRLSLIVRRS
jgi:hypothetical protein